MEDEERLWTNEHVDSVALKHFPSIQRDVSLKRPILYSNWLSKDYVPVEQETLRDYTKARLKVSGGGGDFGSGGGNFRSVAAASILALLQKITLYKITKML